MELSGKNNTEIMEQLCVRYGIAKSSVYKRLRFLKISAKRENGKTFLLSSEVELLDELDNWIHDGKTMETFPKPGVLMKSEESELGTEAVKKILIEEAEEGNQVKQLVRRAQEKAAGILMAQNILAAEYQKNPDLLEGDLKTQVKATEEALVPKPIDPKEYALSLVKQCLQRTAIA